MTDLVKGFAGGFLVSSYFVVFVAMVFVGVAALIFVINEIWEMYKKRKK